MPDPKPMAGEVTGTGGELTTTVFLNAMLSNYFPSVYVYTHAHCCSQPRLERLHFVVDKVVIDTHK